MKKIREKVELKQSFKQFHHHGYLQQGREMCKYLEQFSVRTVRQSDSDRYYKISNEMQKQQQLQKADEEKAKQLQQQQLIEKEQQQQQKNLINGEQQQQENQNDFENKDDKQEEQEGKSEQIKNEEDEETKKNQEQQEAEDKTQQQDDKEKIKENEVQTKTTVTTDLQQQIESANKIQQNTQQNRQMQAQVGIKRPNPALLNPLNEDQLEFMGKKQKFKFNSCGSNIKKDDEEHQKYIEKQRKKMELSKNGNEQLPLDWESKLEKQRFANFQHAYPYKQGALQKYEEIKERDIQSLTEWTYLNDSVINYFLRFLINERVIDLKMEINKIYLFNTFFITKLAPEQDMIQFTKELEMSKKVNIDDYLAYDKQRILSKMKQKMVQEKAEDLRKMTRWAKEDLFDKQFVILPLNKEQHWSIMVVYNLDILKKQIQIILQNRRAKKNPTPDHPTSIAVNQENIQINSENINNLEKQNSITKVTDQTQPDLQQQKSENVKQQQQDNKCMEIIDDDDDDDSDVIQVVEQKQITNDDPNQPSQQPQNSTINTNENCIEEENKNAEQTNDQIKLNETSNSVKINDDINNQNDVIKSQQQQEQQQQNNDQKQLQDCNSEQEKQAKLNESNNSIAIEKEDSKSSSSSDLEIINVKQAPLKQIQPQQQQQNFNNNIRLQQQQQQQQQLQQQQNNRNKQEINEIIDDEGDEEEEDDDEEEDDEDDDDNEEEDDEDEEEEEDQQDEEESSIIMEGHGKPLSKIVPQQQQIVNPSQQPNQNQSQQQQQSDMQFLKQQQQQQQQQQIFQNQSMVQSSLIQQQQQQQQQLNNKNKNNQISLEDDDEDGQEGFDDEDLDDEDDDDEFYDDDDDDDEDDDFEEEEEESVSKFDDDFKNQEYEEDVLNDKYQQPCILYLDSFQNYDEHYIEMIRCFLEKILKQKLSDQFSADELEYVKINETVLPCHQPMCPRQNNSFDCGIFIIEFIEQLLGDPKRLLDIVHSKNQIKLNWFPKILPNKKRRMLKDLVYEFVKAGNDVQLQQKAIQKYKEIRQTIIYEQQMKEFDTFDEQKFNNYFSRLENYKKSQRNEKDCEEFKSQRYKELLNFYYNPANNKNFYDNTANQQNNY